MRLSEKRRGGEISNIQVCRSERMRRNPERAHIRSEIFLEGIDEARNFLEETIIPLCNPRALGPPRHICVTKRLSEIVSCSLLFTNRFSFIGFLFFLQREWSHIRPREIINTKEEKRKTRPRCMPAAVAVSPEWPLRIRLWPRMSLTSSATLSRSNRFWACTGSCAICSGWNPLTSRSSTRNSRSVCRRWRFLNSHLDQNSFPRRRVTDDGVLTLF